MCFKVDILPHLNLLEELVYIYIHFFLICTFSLLVVAYSDFDQSILFGFQYKYSYVTHVYTVFLIRTFLIRTLLLL